MVLDTEKYNKPESANLEDIYYVLESFLCWYPEVKDRLSDAEDAVMQFLIEKTEQILANRQTG